MLRGAQTLRFGCSNVARSTGARVFNRSFAASKMRPSSFSKYRYTMIYGGALSTALIARLFKSIPIALSLASSNVEMIKTFGAYSLFRLSRDYETAIIMGKTGVLEDLGNLLDQQLEDASSLDKGIIDYPITKRERFSKTNFPVAPHKLELISQTWLKRYDQTINHIISRKDSEPIDVALICFSCFLSTLSTYSRIKVSTALAYGGAGDWVKKELDAHEAISFKDLPKFLRILITDQKKHSFSPPATLLHVSMSVATSTIGINLNPAHSDDYLLSFAILTIGELSRHNYSRDYLVQNDILGLLKRFRVKLRSDVVAMPLYIRTLAYLAKNDQAKEEIERDHVIALKKWVEDTEPQTALFTAALLCNLLDNREIGERVAKVINVTKIEQSLSALQISLPAYLMPSEVPQSSSNASKTKTTKE